MGRPLPAPFQCSLQLQQGQPLLQQPQASFHPKPDGLQLGPEAICQRPCKHVAPRNQDRQLGQDHPQQEGGGAIPFSIAQQKLLPSSSQSTSKNTVSACPSLWLPPLTTVSKYTDPPVVRLATAWRPSRVCRQPALHHCPAAGQAQAVCLQFISGSLFPSCTTLSLGQAGTPRWARTLKADDSNHCHSTSDLGLL